MMAELMLYAPVMQSLAARFSFLPVLARMSTLPGAGADGSVACESVTTLPAVHFATGRSNLDREARATLDRVAVVLTSCPELALDIEAHTDATGSDALNARLSEARAASVRGYLVERGVPRERLAAEGFGSSRPVASNATDVGRARNRRIELVIYPEKR